MPGQPFGAPVTAAVAHRAGEVKEVSDKCQSIRNCSVVCREADASRHGLFCKAEETTPKESVVDTKTKEELMAFMHANIGSIGTQHEESMASHGPKPVLIICIEVGFLRLQKWGAVALVDVKAKDSDIHFAHSHQSYMEMGQATKFRLQKLAEMATESPYS